jgi:hypothetical protein
MRLADLTDVHVVERREGIFRRRRFEIWARSRSSDVVLFASADAATFGQVRRAIVRALEANERAPGFDRLQGRPVEAKKPSGSKIRFGSRGSGETSAPQGATSSAFIVGTAAWRETREPVWRRFLERKLHLPLTESGAMLEAIHRFDDRMHRILDAAGAPPTIPHGRGASDE